MVYSHLWWKKVLILLFVCFLPTCTFQQVSCLVYLPLMAFSCPRPSSNSQHKAAKGSLIFQVYESVEYLILNQNCWVLSCFWTFCFYWGIFLFYFIFDINVAVRQIEINFMWCDKYLETFYVRLIKVLLPVWCWSVSVVQALLLLTPAWT